eukprot:scaffold3582_cov143-Skeletonema_marinoi.AAC.8
MEVHTKEQSRMPCDPTPPLFTYHYLQASPPFNSHTRLLKGIAIFSGLKLGQLISTNDPA